MLKVDNKKTIRKLCSRLVVVCFFSFSVVSMGCLCGLCDNTYAKSLSKKSVTTNSTGGSYSAQSFTYDSDKDKIIVLLNNPNKIQVLNGKTFKVEKSGLSSKGGHNNGAAYSPKFKTVLAAPTNHDVGGTFYVYDAEKNYSYKGRISISGGGGTIGYSRQKDVYIGGGHGSFKIMKCSSATRCSKEDKIYINGSGTYNQDGEAYGKYFYLAKSGGGTSYIHKYDLDKKKKVETYNLGGGELESLTFIGTDVYLLYHHSGGGSYHIYKLTDSSAKELLSGAGSNEFNGSPISSGITHTTAGSVNPEDTDEIPKKYRKVKTVDVKKKKAKAVKAKDDPTKNCSSVLPDAWCAGGKDSVMTVLDLVLTVATAGVAILGLLGIVVAGMQYAAAGGSEEMVAKSKRRIAAIVVGLALWVFLYTMLKWALLGGL